MASSTLVLLRQELTKYVGSQVGKLAEKAGDKVAGVTTQLTDVAENGGKLPAIGGPVKAFAADKAKGVKDSVVDKAKGAVGRGDSDRKAGDAKVTSMIETLDVGVPLRTAYDSWTEYEQFGSFTKGVQTVSKNDDVTSEWKAKVGPSSRSFTATVEEQVPDERIIWKSEGAKGTTKGAVTFHELTPSLTRIVLVVEYYPAGFFEKTGNLWRAQGRRLRLDFKNFQRYVTLTDEEPEGWRGEIRDGEVVVTHEEALEAEEEDQDDGEYENEDEEDEEEDPEADEAPEAEDADDDTEWEDEEEEEEPRKAS